MEEIAGEFGLKLDEPWNKMELPHQGRHPNKYHEFVLDGMEKARDGAGGDANKFKELFTEYVIKPVTENKDLLRKAGWE